MIFVVVQWHGVYVLPGGMSATLLGCRNVDGEMDGMGGGGNVGSGYRRLCASGRAGSLVHDSAMLLKQHPPRVPGWLLLRHRFSGVDGTQTMPRCRVVLDFAWFGISRSLGVMLLSVVYILRQVSIINGFTYRASEARGATFLASPS